MREVTPLKWPEGWPRTLPENQRGQAQWKKSLSYYMDALEKELTRMGTEASVLTTNGRGARDQGVAIWFSRTKKEDFSWRVALEITAPYPSVDDINAAYRKLSMKYHPDNQESGDGEIFRAITKAKATAIDWVNRREGKSYDSAIANDTFNEIRLNIAGLVGTIQAIRKIERCGSSALMEKTWQGFVSLPENASEVKNGIAVPA
jgi:hypothetical protein